MSQYEGRHRPRHAKAPAPRSAVLGKALGKPAVTSSLALAVVATTAAGVTAGGKGTATAASFTLSNEAISQANEQSDAAIEDASRLIADRSAANVSRSALGERQRLEAAAAAEAAEKARREAADRAAREELLAKQAAIIANAIADPRSVAKLLMLDYGWGGSTQFSCLDSLWTKESGWNYQAYNPSSGAYGIPQALPGSKMATVASDWRTNPATQIKWGLNYISQIYGTACSAWAHSQATGWY
jgi:Transglycosylase SLT domain